MSRGVKELCSFKELRRHGYCRCGASPHWDKSLFFLFFCLSTVQSSIPMTNIIGARMVGYLLALVSVMFA